MILNKKTYIIAGISVVVILLAASIYYLVITKKIDLPSAGTATSQAELDKAAEKKIYEDYQAKMAIVYAKNIEDCAKLDSQKRINECFNDIAISAKKKSYCERITDGKLKEECVNSIDYLVASWGEDPNACDSLVGDAHRNNCYQEYFVKLSTTTDCTNVRNETRKTQCVDLVNNRLATVLGKPEACDLITDQTLKTNCQKNKYIPAKDSDKDGLSDDIEMSLGTDPFKADTDGDGVSDYDEINKTHTSPLSSDTDSALTR